jgi:hypothetical protein
MTATEFPADGHAAKDGATAKEKHDFLVALLKESRYGLVDFMFKQAAILFLFLGWIMTSDSVRQFLASSPSMRTFCIFLTIFYAVAFAKWTTTFRNRSTSA